MAWLWQQREAAEHARAIQCGRLHALGRGRLCLNQVMLSLDVETSLYAKLGVNAKHAGAHVAALMKAALENHTVV